MGSMGSEELVCRSQLGVLGLLRALFLHGGALWSCRREFSVPFLGPRNPFTVKTDSGRGRKTKRSAGQVRETMQLPTPAPWSSWAVGLWRSGRVGSFTTWEDILILTKIRHLTASPPVSARRIEIWVSPCILHVGAWCINSQGIPGLDALAHHWHLHGLNAMSVQWGPWLEVGMAAPWREILGGGMVPGLRFKQKGSARRKHWGMSNKVGLMGIVALRGCPKVLIISWESIMLSIMWWVLVTFPSMGTNHLKRPARHKTTPSRDWRSMALATSHWVVQSDEPACWDK